MALPKLSKPKTSSVLQCSFRLERESGFSRILGIDEVGRGCLAGPVVAAGVVFSPDLWQSREKWLSEVDDSKMVKAEKREALSELIHKNALAVEVSFCMPDEIDRLNIVQATFKAARNIIAGIEKKLNASLELILMDGSLKISQVKHRQHPVVSGDRISKSIAAASIVAKVYRDRWMGEFGSKHPGYGFEKHKGYGTKEHLIALRKLGASPLHRKSFLRKLDALAYGREAEEAVAKFLQDNGFNIIDRNWRVDVAEIDLIAEKNKELHFVEVRYRSQGTELPLIFPPSKQSQVKRAVDFYFFKNPLYRSLPFHIHFFSVTPDRIVPFWDVFKF